MYDFEALSLGLCGSPTWFSEPEVTMIGQDRVVPHEYQLLRFYPEVVMVSSCQPQGSHAPQAEPALSITVMGP